MSLLSLTPNLLVEDVNETARYYTEVLGFELTLGVIEGTENPVFGPTEERLGFAILKCDAVELMLQSYASVKEDLPGFEPPAAGDAVALYLDVEDVDGLWQRLKDRVEVIKELGDTFYGAREFHFRDHNGFLIGFAQRPASQEH